MNPASSAPEPSADISVTLTEAQAIGIAIRRSAVVAADRELAAFVAGVLSGHGHDNVHVKDFNPETRVLTITRSV